MPKTLNHYSNGIKKHVFLFLLSIIAFNSSFSQNAIVTENQLTGNPISDWGVNSSSDFRNTNLNGFATDISVNKGSTVHFKIDDEVGGTYTIKVYRLGYYGGMGASLKANLGTFTAFHQPAGIFDSTTGLLDCSNWTESASWAVPSNAVSGFYVVKLQNTSGDINNIVFIVRDDASHSNIFFQTNDATWQAYNGYGGNNLYNGTTNFPSGHAVKVSYNRPFFIYNSGFATDGRGSDWFMNDAYPMIRWLERNGYDVSYTTSIDLVRAGSLVSNHKILVTNGHDEYWSKEMRTNVETARAAGLNLAFFSGNEVYWKTRWEADVNGTPDRVLVCYKEGTLADGSTGEATCGYKCDPNPTVWTGLWRMGSAYDAPLPENALTGEISWDQPAAPGYGVPILVPDTYKNLRFWRNTSIAGLSAGQTATLGPNTMGYEFDYEQFPASYPDGRITLSSTVLNGNTHKLSLYRFGGTGGPLVFGAGTVQWAWGLDEQHFGGSGNVVNKDMQQATVNLFADMGVQPGSLQTGLAAVTASTDTTAPVSIITLPANGSSNTINTTVIISGTASDAGGAVGGVEVSVDGGTTWQVATGTTSWTFSWNPLNPGSYTIKSRAYDDSGNMENSNPGTGKNLISITLTTPTCSSCNIFTTQIPAVPTSNDGQAIELGVKFRSISSGSIKGIRFYKTSGNSGTHIGELYTSTGTRLAQATFAGETATGWQTVSFSTPVAISPNTTYVAAYYSSGGNYTGTADFFTSAVVNSPLTGLADGTDGSNGLYDYSATPTFPTSSPNNQPNYWVDVVFSSGSSSPTSNAGSNQTVTLPISSVTLDGSNSSGTISSYAWSLVSGPNTPVITTPAAVTTTVTGLIQGVYTFQLSLNAGISTSQVTETVLAAGTSTTIFTTQTPSGVTSNDGQALELGVKFRSSQSGFITGVRFYKTTGNTGTHTGELYSSTGTRLSQAIFTGETASGWQNVSFSSPVAITANTTYVAAYFSSSGNYTGTANYFTTAVVNSPLTGLADGTDGSNGVYQYSSTPVFPASSPNNKPNYWVDAIFSANISPTANAGTNQIITLPTSSVTLNGSGSVGTISNYTWSLISGPNSPVITTPGAVSTSVSGLIQGTYIFQLSINDGVSTSQVSVTVNPIPPPTANAGTNQTITLPTSTVTLDGSGSIGTISSYSWSLISGPNTPVITSPGTVTTTVTGLIQGTYIFQLSLNAGVSTSQTTVTVLAAGSGINIFTTQTPATGTSNDGQALELGVKFQSSQAGYITGIRFYKTAGNSGTHTGELYLKSSGARLAQATFMNETATGWQTVSFSSPVAITANTTYVAAYFSSSGNYTGTANYFTAAVTNNPLTGLADGTDGPNGVYQYSNTPVFPTSSPNNKPNYWVDAVFSINNPSVQSATFARNGKASDSMNQDDSSSVKPNYYLGQNYPNPVNQNTRIAYSIPISAKVELVLFDLQGRQIKILVNETKEAGEYYYDLNTAVLAKGIYVYRIHSGNFWAVKKMVVE